jgi:hypothetical protein
MQHDTLNSLFASIGAFSGLLAIVVWADIDPFEVELGLTIAFMIIALEVRYSNSL